MPSEVSATDLELTRGLHHQRPWHATLQGWRVVGLFYALGLFTSSFDIFAVLNLGMNIRAAQLLLALPIVVGLLLALVKTVRLPLGFRSLSVWTAFILVFVPNTTYLARSIGYAMWLLYSVLLIFATVQLFTTVEQVVWLLRCYLYSFCFVAVFGLVQLVSPVLGLGAPLVTQWWIPNLLPRINGFSYEPSFFVTYMLLGWTLSIVLLQYPSTILPRSRLRLIFALCTMAMVLSSSRSGWLMIALWSVQYPVRFVLRLLRGRIQKRFFAYSLAIVAAALVIVAVVNFVGPQTFFFLLTGTGLLGSAAQSVLDRKTALYDTLRVFLNSPIIGYSLGGVGIAIANLHGFVVTSFEDTKLFEGNSVFAEVLAASGVVGFLAFGLYVVTLVVQPLRLARSPVDERMRQLLVAMTAALVLEFLILQINQNILRPYLWIHIALLSALYSVAQGSRSSHPSGPPAPSSR